ncbi:MAG: hypothetical protein EOP89_07300, partial [Lysobacteraceae bacterium]
MTSLRSTDLPQPFACFSLRRILPQRKASSFFANENKYSPAKSHGLSSRGGLSSSKDNVRGCKRVITRNRLRTGIALTGIAFWSLSGVAIAQPPTDAVSPDRRNRIDVTADGGKLHFSVTRDGKAVIAPSPVGLFTDQGALGGDGVEVTGTDRTSVSDVYRPVVGKASQV